MDAYYRPRFEQIYRVFDFEIELFWFIFFLLKMLRIVLGESFRRTRLGAIQTRFLASTFVVRQKTTLRLFESV